MLILAAATALLFAAPLAREAGLAQAAETVKGKNVVLVELFTSQGCNLCPPADALLEELNGRSDVIGLSLHVDYWDYIGWKDPFGSPANTARQQRYAESLNLRYVFTPQMIVDGRATVIGSRRDEVLAAIDSAAGQDKPLEIRLVTEGGGKLVIPAGQAPEAGATIWLALYDAAQETEVKRGENAGRKLRTVNVVRDLERIGTWMGDRLEIPLDLSVPAARGRDGCAIIVQEGRSGRVLAAAIMPLSSLGQ